MKRINSARVGAFAVGVSLVLVTGSAFAQGDTADSLFRKGRAAMSQGKFAEACGLFGDSFKIEAAPGTLLNLADCEEKKGDLMKSRADFAKVQGFLPAGDDRAAIVQGRITALTEKIPTLTLKIPEGASITMDGAAVSAEMYTTPAPIDPGDHVIVVKSAGHQDNELHIKLAEKDRNVTSLELGASSTSLTATGTTAESTTTPGANTSSTSSTSATHAQGGGVNIPGWAGVGASVILIGVGTATGLAAISSANAVHTYCPGGVCGDAFAQSTAQGSASSASALGVVSTIAFGLGAVAAGAGIYFLTHPLGGEKTASFAPIVDAKTAGAAFHLTF